MNGLVHFAFTHEFGNSLGPFQGKYLAVEGRHGAVGFEAVLKLYNYFASNVFAKLCLYCKGAKHSGRRNFNGVVFALFAQSRGDGTANGFNLSDGYVAFEEVGKNLNVVGRA